ncbi:MAG: N-formylglutamate amidohydrolase [Pseudomonadota bacterium]
MPDPTPPATASGPQAFTLDLPDPIGAPVLFSSPHSGSFYPEAMKQNMHVSLMTLRRTEDAFVDELFDKAPRLGAAFIRGNYARGYVDLNRNSRELDADMFKDGLPRAAAVNSPRVRAGLGCIPRTAPDGRPIYDDQLSQADGRTRLEKVYDVYHKCVAAYLEHLHSRFGAAVLIDCHSMPSTAMGRSGLPDIVLGDRFGSSCTNQLTRRIERSFRSLGYSVKRNAPYAGGHTTRLYGRPKRNQHAIQIEIRRDLYMNEQEVAKSARFGQFRRHIHKLMPDWINWAQSLTSYRHFRSAAE